MNDNIYHHPEKFGLETVYECDLADTYEFDMLVIFKRISDGQLFLATDSGCSCPSPFEDLTLKDLVAATPDAVREWFDEGTHKDERGPDDLPNALEVFEIIDNQKSLKSNSKGVLKQEGEKMSDPATAPDRFYSLPDGSGYTFSGRMTDEKLRMLACEILSKLKCDFNIGNPTMHPIDYAAWDLLKFIKEWQERICGGAKPEDLDGWKQEFDTEARHLISRCVDKR